MRREFIIAILSSLVVFSVAIASSQQLTPSILASQNPANQTGYTEGSPSIPAQFSGDWYEVSGGPDLQISLARSSVYRNENSSLDLTVTNIGRVTSFKVLTQPESSRPEEVFAAQKELQLEALRSTAQDVSVRLLAQNSSAMNIKREVAYAGTIRDGQVSSVISYPVEVYENTEPGYYTLYAVANYTYQQDVAVKPHSDSPQNPDVFYWYKAASQIIPLTLHIEKRSLVDLKAISASPESITVGSKNNILKVEIQNNGTDTAKNLVARLRPETGIYVDMDESPVATLKPGEKAGLVYKVDVSKDAISGKSYRFTLLFDYEDTYRKNLHDSDYVYISLQPSLYGLILQYWWGAAIILIVVAIAAISKIRQRRIASGQQEHPA